MQDKGEGVSEVGPILKTIHRAMVGENSASIRSLRNSEGIGFRRHAHAPSYLDGLMQNDAEAGIIQIVKDLAEGNESLMHQISDLRTEHDRMRDALFAMAYLLDDKLNKEEKEDGLGELLERH
jgi:hypothetical protein